MKIYNDKKDKELSITIKTGKNEFQYFDEKTYLPNKALIGITRDNLNNIWEPSCQILNIMNESQVVRDQREILATAPFQWTFEAMQNSA